MAASHIQSQISGYCLKGITVQSDKFLSGQLQGIYELVSWYRQPHFFTASLEKTVIECSMMQHQ